MKRWSIFVSLGLIAFFPYHIYTEPIVFAMPPRTASNYIPAYVAEGLGRGLTRKLSIHGGFPHQDICPVYFQLIASKNHVTRAHIDPSDENLELICQAKGKVFVCVRDLRQNVVSWIFHEENLLNTKQYHLIDAFQVPHPSNYYQWPFEKRLNWNIEHYIPTTIQWIHDWQKAAERYPDMITFVTYEDFMNDRDKFISDIVSFLKLDKEEFRQVNLPPSENLHYRKGLVDEWKTILDKEQVERIESMIPQEYFEAFGWVR